MAFFFTVIVAIISGCLLHAHWASVQVCLKKDMLDRGMIAQDIALVMNSGQNPSDVDEEIKLMKAKKELQS